MYVYTQLLQVFLQKYFTIQRQAFKFKKTRDDPANLKKKDLLLRVLNY